MQVGRVEVEEEDMLGFLGIGFGEGRGGEGRGMWQEGGMSCRWIR